MTFIFSGTGARWQAIICSASMIYSLFCANLVLVRQVYLDLGWIPISQAIIYLAMNQFCDPHMQYATKC